MMGFQDSMFNNFDSIFMIMFGFFVVIVVVMIVSRGAEMFKNSQSPKVSAHAIIKAKRVKVYHSHNNSSDMGFDSSSSTYYATFEFDTRDRIELRIPTTEYGLLAENDQGTLTFQGTKYISFTRD